MSSILKYDPIGYPGPAWAGELPNINARSCMYNLSIAHHCGRSFIMIASTYHFGDVYPAFTCAVVEDFRYVQTIRLCVDMSEPMRSIVMAAARHAARKLAKKYYAYRQQVLADNKSDRLSDIKHKNQSKNPS